MENENNNTKLSLNLLVDKHQNRVVFAEADRQFVDILFSFLTLPIGTIIRLLNKQSPLSHMNKLYQSIADLDERFFETAACKSMLLFPRSAAERVWGNLRINVDDMNSRRFYKCRSIFCNHGNCCSLIPHGRCPCGASMIDEMTEIRPSGVKGFVEESGEMTFMVGDDMRVSLVSTAAILSLLEKLGIRDGTVLESRVVELGRDEILSLLKRCMTSTMPLSEVFLGRLPAQSEVLTRSIMVSPTNVKMGDADNETDIQRMEVKIIKAGLNYKVVYSEAGKDFIDFLFSFLTLPLGSIMKLLKSEVRLGCLNNLYNSIEILGDSKTCIMSEDCRSMLLSPKLPPHFGISNLMLRVYEMHEMPSMPSLWGLTNLKLPGGGKEPGGGFVKESGLFLVTEELEVTPFSPISAINLVNQFRIPVTDLVERVISLGENEALDLLKVCMIRSRKPRPHTKLCHCVHAMHGEKNRVLFAESGKEFVDILFSFLTLPMGTVIRVLDKQSSVGCMDSLYQSIENLDAKFLQTFSCKEMLLQPRCYAELDCEYLKIKVDELDPRRYYLCCCCWKFFGTVSGVYCCGKVMQKNVHSAKGKSGAYDDGVFVKGRVWFLICDDLHVIKATTGSTISLLQKLGIKNADVLERKTVEFGRQEVLNLLKRSLVSKSPLTDVFLQKERTSESLVEEIELIDIGNVKSEKDKAIGSSKLHVKLFKSDATGEFIFAEVDKEFGDLLFSFLTFPLGSIVKLLNKNSFRGFIDQLYTSVENLGVGDCIKCQDNKSLLLDHKLPIYFGCSGSLLKIDEGSSLRRVGEEINPKLPVPGKEKGGGFAKESIKYTFTDECDVSIIFSPISTIEILKGLKVPTDRLVEKNVAVGELEALKLLKACITSRSALSSVFSPETKSKTQGAKS